MFWISAACKSGRTQKTIRWSSPWALDMAAPNSQIEFQTSSERSLRWCCFPRYLGIKFKPRSIKSLQSLSQGPCEGSIVAENFLLKARQTCKTSVLPQFASDSHFPKGYWNTGATSVRMVEHCREPCLEVPKVEVSVEVNDKVAAECADLSKRSTAFQWSMQKMTKNVCLVTLIQMIIQLSICMFCDNLIKMRHDCPWI